MVDAWRVRRKGRLTLRGTLADVVPLFTAEGERRWVADWEPWFPLRDHVHERGEVWTTTAAAGPTIWVTADRRADGVLLARVTPNVSAGLVEVTCRPGFDDMLATWQRLAQAVLDQS